MKKLFLATVTMTAVCCGYLGFKSGSCAMRWHGTGYETKWEMIAGCLVQQSNSKWLPEEKVRSE